MRKRMMMTQRQTLPVKKPTAREAAVPKRDDERAKEAVGSTQVERFDWRGEGVVGDNHTD